MTTLYTHQQLPQNSFSRGPSPQTIMFPTKPLPKNNELQFNQSNISSHQNHASNKNSFHDYNSGVQQGFKRHSNATISQTNINSFQIEHSQNLNMNPNMNSVEIFNTQNSIQLSNFIQGQTQSSLSSISTQCSGNYPSQNFYSPDSKIDINYKNEYQLSQTKSRNIFFERNSYPIDQQKQNSYTSPQNNASSNLNNQFLFSQKSSNSIRSYAPSIHVPAPQFSQNSNISCLNFQSKQKQSECQQSQMRFDLQNHNQENLNTTETQNNIQKKHKRIFSSTLTQNQQQIQISSNSSGRSNNFINQPLSPQGQNNLFLRQQPQKPFVLKIETKSDSFNIPSPILSNISKEQQSFFTVNSSISKEYNCPGQNLQDNIQKKNELRNMIEAKQKELEGLKKESKDLRLNSIDAYKEINQKLANHQSTSKNQRFHSTSKLNHFILNKFSSQNNQEPIKTKIDEPIKQKSS